MNHKQLATIIALTLVAASMIRAEVPAPRPARPMDGTSGQTPSTAEDQGIEFFERRIRPIFAEHCQECHGAGTKQRGNLVLDSKEALLRGGDTGPAIIPGDPEKSLLIQAVRQDGDLAMPPERKLSAEQIATLEKWVRSGAPFPKKNAQSLVGIEARLGQAKSHWAFQPLAKAEPPAVNNSNWVTNDIDRFILRKLESAGLKPTPPADPATLIRRVTFDLIGLPPTPSEVAAFVSDSSPRAYEQLVDRLLASPHYGERWARHWLDLARYADSSGFHNDLDRPYAWKYRDYVIRSFMEDKPYPQFVAEQLAGDEVPHADETTLIATGFCRNGPSNDDNMGKTDAAIKQYRADQLDDVISTAGAVFLGITIGCARCHDHKTDPFTAKDYYSLLAVFNGTERFGSAPETDKLPGAKDKTNKKYHLQALIETKSNVPTTHVMRRGIATNLAEEVGPAVPAVLAGASVLFPAPPPDAKSSLRRLTLANWITSPDNPLAWRVLANRIWQHHFGRGIVLTPSNFGFAGGTPSHPELLDYLARHLIASGGRWKPVHKQILLSATYRQSSKPPAENVELDPANRLVSRMNLRRMEAEIVRDAILAASGKLNPTFGGPGIKPRLPADLIPASQRNKWPLVSQEDETHWRRSVYIYSKRQLLMPILELFDAPTTTDSCPQRMESVVPTQSLVLMNDEFVEAQAGYLAERVLSEAGDDPERALDRMFQIVLGSPPGRERLRQAAAFVADRASAGDRVSAFTDLAHVLFNSSEFIHIQ
jgi:mono/diheme cytochrome c family protein